MKLRNFLAFAECNPHLIRLRSLVKGYGYKLFVGDSCSTLASTGTLSSQYFVTLDNSEGYSAFDFLYRYDETFTTDHLVIEGQHFTEVMQNVSIFQPSDSAKIFTSLMAQEDSPFFQGRIFQNLIKNIFSYQRVHQIKLPAPVRFLNKYGDTIIDKNESLEIDILPSLAGTRDHWLLDTNHTERIIKSKKLPRVRGVSLRFNGNKNKFCMIPFTASNDEFSETHTYIRPGFSYGTPFTVTCHESKLTLNWEDSRLLNSEAEEDSAFVKSIISLLSLKEVTGVEYQVTIPEDVDNGKREELLAILSGHSYRSSEGRSGLAIGGMAEKGQAPISRSAVP